MTNLLKKNKTKQKCFLKKNLFLEILLPKDPLLCVKSHFQPKDPPFLYFFAPPNALYIENQALTSVLYASPPPPKLRRAHTLEIELYLIFIKGKNNLKSKSKVILSKIARSNI